MFRSLKTPLTEEEWYQLTHLLRRVTWPLPHPVFRALVGVTVSVPIELAVLSADSENVLLYYRKDNEYEGNHMPGTVLRDNEGVAEAIKRLVESELVGACVSNPVFVDWVEIEKGSGPGQNPSRHEVSMIFACWLLDKYSSHGGRLFPIDRLPTDTLIHHRTLVNKVINWLER